MNRPTSKVTLIIVLVLVLAVIGVVFYFRSGTAGVVQNPAPVDTNDSSEWPSAIVRDVNLDEDASYYSIDAVYPQVKDDVITGYFKSFVTDAIAQFKEDTSWAQGDGADIAPAEAGSLSLGITYKEEKSARADNFVFSITTYTGGAHGLQATKSFSFSPTGQQIMLASLFTNGADGLKTVAPYVQQQLAKMPDANEDMIKDGTAPTELNFQNFVVTDEGITFTFDPYQVAPYSSGTQTVDVPLSVFRKIASPDVFGK